MDLFLIILFLIQNIYYFVSYCRKKDGVYMAPFIVITMSLFTILPQLFTIYTNPLYNNDIIINLVIVMILSHFCFVSGFEKGIRKSLPRKIKDLDVSKYKSIIVLFAFFGVLGGLMYRFFILGADWVIAGQFQSFGCIAFILSFIGIMRSPNNKYFYVLFLIISVMPILDFAFSIKGSRSRAFYILLISFFFLSRIYPKYKSKINNCFIILFFVGSLIGMSIGNFRQVIADEISFKDINFVENYKQSFGQEDISINGMDLGNSALGIEYCYKNSDYNYGANFINKLIYNYIPRRLVGEDIKESLYMNAENRDITLVLTNGVTTMTGYYDVFSSFSFLGAILFLIVGYFLGYLFTLSRHSDFYLVLYLYLLMFSPIMISHGFTNFVSHGFFFAVFVLPFLFFRLSDKYKIGEIKKYSR